MDGFLDIYSRLIIALLSFTAPLVTYLLSISIEEIAQFKKQSIEKVTQMNKLRNRNVDDSIKNNTTTIKLLESEVNEFFLEGKALKKKVNLLKPMRQIYRMFIPLMLSLIFLMAEKIVKDKSLNINSQSACLVLILLSVCSLVYALFVFKQVAQAAIEAKQSVSLKSGQVMVGSE